MSLQVIQSTRPTEPAILPLAGGRGLRVLITNAYGPYDSEVGPVSERSARSAPRARPRHARESRRAPDVVAVPPRREHHERGDRPGVPTLGRLRESDPRRVRRGLHRDEDGPGSPHRAHGQGHPRPSALHQDRARRLRGVHDPRRRSERSRAPPGIPSRQRRLLLPHGGRPVPSRAARRRPVRSARHAVHASARDHPALGRPVHHRRASGDPGRRSGAPRPATSATPPPSSTTRRSRCSPRPRSTTA